MARGLGLGEVGPNQRPPPTENGLDRNSTNFNPL